jgi:hypothetical protein
MLIHGTIIQNLESAIASATRLRGRPVYGETLAHWNAVLELARNIGSDRDETSGASYDLLVARLDAELQRRIAELPPLLGLQDCPMIRREADRAV